MITMRSMARGKHTTFSGVRLRALRESHHLTQDDLAAELKLGQGQLNRYELGKNSPSVDKVIAFARFFNVSTDYLFGLTDDPTGNLSTHDLSKAEVEMVSALRRGDWVEFHRLLATIPQQKIKPQ